MEAQDGSPARASHGRNRPASPTLVLIPAKDEAECLPGVLDDLRSYHDPAHTLVIDDGSTDDTADIARSKGCHAISHPFNLGYGASLLTGYQYALRNGYEQVVQMDADGQHRPADLWTVLEPVARGEADVTIGSRYLEHGDHGTSWIRRFAAREIARLASIWTKTKITDPTSGYQALSLDALTWLCSDGFPEDYPDVDILISAHRAGLRLREVAVRMLPRETGASMHRGLRVAYYFYRLTLALVLLPIRRRSLYRNQRTPGEVVRFPATRELEPAGKPRRKRARTS